jgi:hypothetical protein
MAMELRRMELTQNKSIFALFGQFYVELEVSPEA